MCAVGLLWLISLRGAANTPVGHRAAATVSPKPNPAAMRTPVMPIQTAVLMSACGKSTLSTGKIATAVLLRVRRDPISSALKPFLVGVIAHGVCGVPAADAAAAISPNRRLNRQSRGRQRDHVHVRPSSRYRIPSSRV